MDDGAKPAAAVERKVRRKQAEPKGPKRESETDLAQAEAKAEAAAAQLLAMLDLEESSKADRAKKGGVTKAKAKAKAKPNDPPPGPNLGEPQNSKVMSDFEDVFVDAPLPDDDDDEGISFEELLAQEKARGPLYVKASLGHNEPVRGSS
jgi:hypothetical protein